MRDLLPSCARKRVFNPFWSLVLIATALSGSLGCGDETSIIVNVYQGEELAIAPDRLRILAGTPVVENPELEPPYCGENDALQPDCQRFIYSAESEDTIGVAGRNLNETPYRFAVRPTDESLTAPVILVLAYDAAGQAIGAGVLNNVSSFAKGKILEYEVRLRPKDDVIRPDKNAVLGRSPDLTQSCLCANVEGLGPIELAVDDDRDCNGLPDDALDADGDADGDRWTNCSDCDDNNSGIHPKADDICDGIDTNCNPQLAVVEDRRCYTTEPEACGLGYVNCIEDEDPATPQYECINPDIFPDELQRLGDRLCAESERQQCPLEDPDHLQCVNEDVVTRFSTCRVPYFDGDQVPCENLPWIPNLPAIDDCTWIILGGSEQGIGTENYSVAFRDPENPDGFTTRIQPGTCAPDFHVHSINKVDQTSGQPVADDMLVIANIPGVTNGLELIKVRLEPTPIDGPEGCFSKEALGCDPLLPALLEAP